MTKLAFWAWELLLVSVVVSRRDEGNMVRLQPFQLRDAGAAASTDTAKYTLPYDVLHPPLQKVLLDQVLALSAVLEKHNFTFWVDSGTALGAVRDGALIPYDNDVDIGVFIKDWSTESGDREYDRLLALSNELANYNIVPTPPHEAHWNSFYEFKENANQRKFYAFSGPKGKDTGARCSIFVFRENGDDIEQLFPFHRSVEGPDVVVAKFKKDWIFPLATATLGGQKVPVVANLIGQFHVAAKAKTEAAAPPSRWWGSFWGDFVDRVAARYTRLMLLVRPDRCYDESLNDWRPYFDFEARCATYCLCPGPESESWASLKTNQPWVIVAVLVLLPAIAAVVMYLAFRRLGSQKSYTLN